MIKTLVYGYTDPRSTDGSVPTPWIADFMENTRERRIFLLHGSPGIPEHVVIRYDNPDANDRKKIWANFFNKVKIQRGKSMEVYGAAKRYVPKGPEMTAMP
ncbi:hypothetical protein DL771_003084 [Monosporascus sp. 5C6A]|nr:hypothetical protein DL771_003084 [Monosporascus sp. 5C6A]